MIEGLTRWALFVYGPLLDDRARPIQEKRSGAYGATVAESGLGSVFLHLAAEINWYRLFHELIDDFEEAVLDRRQQAALAAAGVPQSRERKRARGPRSR